MKKSLMAAVVAMTAGSAMALPPLSMTTLYKDGDVIGEVGLMTFVNGGAVNNSGHWLVEIDTDNPNGDADVVLLRNGTLQLQEGQALPGGFVLSSLDDLTINGNGDSGWNFFLDGLPTGLDSGIFFNDTLVFQEGFVSTAAEYPSGAPYTGFFGVRLTDSNRMIVVASIDDPAVTGTANRAIVQVDYNEVAGTFTETVLAKASDVLPSPGTTITDLSTDSMCFALNNSGTALYIAESTGGVTDTVFVGETAVMQEGQPSPEAGRNWELLGDRPVDLNNGGDWVARANLTGDTLNDEVLVKNNAIYVREGQSIPAIGAFAFTAFGTGPVLIDDGGNVIWFGDWNDTDTTRDTGLFWNQELLIQEGVTTIDGLLVEDIRGITDGYFISDNGKWLLVRVTFDDPNSTTAMDGIVLIEFNLSTCGSADFDGDGDTGTDADIEAFFACLGGNCCGTCGTADFDGDGDTGTDADIEAFFRVLGGGTC